MRTLHTQRGATLLEVLIAVLVLAIGLLGLAALQARALQENQSAYLRTQANVLAYDILDRMRANRPSVVAGGYDYNNNNADPLDSPPEPSGGGIPETDLRTWKGELAALLPQGSGRVACVGTQCVVTVQWFEKSYNDDRDADGDVDNKDKTLQIQMVSTL